MAEAEANTRPSHGALRHAFREYENGIAFDNARRAAVFAAIFMLAGWSLDLVVFTDQAWTFLLIRTLCALLLLGIFLILGHSRHTQSFHAVAQGIALLPLISICWMIALTDGGNSVYYAGLNIVLVGLSLLLRWSFWNSLGIIVCSFACYALSIWISPVSPDFRTLFGNSYFLFVTSVFVIAGSFFYESLRFSEFCLRMEVERSRELLESQNQQLSALDEAKTRFFANISHELRTPLTIMLGITERLKNVLARQALEPGVDEMTTMLEQNGLRLLKLIDDLLDLVRFDTGHADINRQATPITAHLDGLLRSLRHLAEQDRVALLWDCRTDHESIQLDRDKFDKILLNLVINAIKFTPSGGSIEVKVSVAQNLLRLTVEDTGVGIPPEVLPRIFERFWQVDTSSTRKFQGAGIGLSLVRSLSEAMDGSVKVDSKPGQGTIFTIELPTEPATPQEAESSAAADADHASEGRRKHRPTPSQGGHVHSWKNAP